MTASETMGTAQLLVLLVLASVSLTVAVHSNTKPWTFEGPNLAASQLQQRSGHNTADRTSAPSADRRDTFTSQPELHHAEKGDRASHAHVESAQPNPGLQKKAQQSSAPRRPSHKQFDKENNKNHPQKSEIESNCQLDTTTKDSHKKKPASPGVQRPARRVQPKVMPGFRQPTGYTFGQATYYDSILK